MLGLAGQGLGFVELCAGLVDMGLIQLRVNYKQCLACLYICTLGEAHLLQIALHTRMHLNKLLGTDTAYIFAVDIYVGNVDFLYLHYRQWCGLSLGTHHKIDCGRSYKYNQNYHYPRTVCAALMMPRLICCIFFGSTHIGLFALCDELQN